MTTGSAARKAMRRPAKGLSGNSSGTDGKDIGADLDAIEKATAGVN